MAMHWLGDSELDRWVFLVLRSHASANEMQLAAEICRRLREAGIVTEGRILPDENDIWCSLQRLASSGQIVKYVSESVTECCIRYRIDVRR